ncbi:MAG: secretin N-terminal domain-containing protein [Gemmatimonadales bacterium]
MRPSTYFVAVALAIATAWSAPPARAQSTSSTPGGTRHVSVTWEAAPLAEVLRAFAAFSGASIVAGAGVEGFVTANIDDQPWDVALEAILASLGLFAVEEASGIIRVQDMADVAERETIEPLVTRSYRLSFARAAEIQGALTPVLSPRGSISVLESTNTVIVSDIARVHGSIADLLR